MILNKLLKPNMRYVHIRSRRIVTLTRIDSLGTIAEGTMSFEVVIINSNGTECILDLCYFLQTYERLDYEN